MSDQSAGPRDRRDDGRPEQARPRDRTGRPLPYGTDDVPLTEDHEPATVQEALSLGIELWTAERFFEAHECLEAVWHAAPDEDRDLWQGVIQIAVAGVHLQRENPTGARTLLDRAASRLRGYPTGYRGIDVAGAVAFCEDAAARIDAEGLAGAPAPPRFPATGDGAWFAAEPGATEPPSEPTPVRDSPAWRDAADARSARR